MVSLQQSVLTVVSGQAPTPPASSPAAPESAKPCPQCGKQPVGVAKFCPNCGQRLSRQLPLLSPAGLAPSTLPLSPWRTIHTFCGLGSRQTLPFQVREHWRLVWNCEPAAVERVGYVIVVQMQGPNGSPTDSDLQVVYEHYTTSGVDVICSGGQVCLHIISEGQWIVQVQERNALTSPLRVEGTLLLR